MGVRAWNSHWSIVLRRFFIGNKSGFLYFPVLERTKYQASGKIILAGGRAVAGNKIGHSIEIKCHGDGPFVLAYFFATSR